MTTGAERRAAPKGARARRNTIINIRAPQQTRDLIEKAAEVSGKTMTGFILDSATQRAMDVLLDQRFFALTDEQYRAFQNVLDNPPPPNEKLKQLMRRKAPWET
jgi:uncharacterized protein (DUF1778 family)